MWANGQSDLYHAVTSPSRKPSTPRKFVSPDNVAIPTTRMAYSPTSPSKRSIDESEPTRPREKRRSSMWIGSGIHLDQTPFFKRIDELQKSKEAVMEFGLIIDQCLHVLQLMTTPERSATGVKATHRGLMSSIIASAFNLAVCETVGEVLAPKDGMAWKEAVNKALQRISNSRLTAVEQFQVGAVVHAAWASSLPRESVDATNVSNVPYIMLGGTIYHEKVKTLASCGARFILEKLNQEEVHSPSLVWRDDVPKQPSWDVFLGGSCGHTTWRRDIAIPRFSQVTPAISYFNPQVGEGEWSHELIAVEVQAKANSKVYLMVITAETAGMASMVEVAELCGKGFRIFLVCHEVQQGGIKNVSEEGRKDINRGRRYLIDSAQRAAPRVSVYDTVEAAVEGVIQFLRGADEATEDIHFLRGAEEATQEETEHVEEEGLMIIGRRGATWSSI